MGYHATINIKSSVPAESLAIRVAVALDAEAYFNDGAGYGYTLPADDAARSMSWVSLSLNPRDVLVDGDVGSLADTALEPYEYELMVEMIYEGARASLERTRSAARHVFEKLIDLGFPLSLTEEDAFMYADHLPGRGLREFDSGISIEVDGRPQWFDTTLYSDVRRSWPSVDPSPKVHTVRLLACETRGLISVIPLAADGSGGVLAPALAMRLGEVSLTQVGRELYSYFDHFSRFTAQKSTPMRSLGSLSEMLDETLEQFLLRTIAFEVTFEGMELTVTPCARLVLGSDDTLRSDDHGVRRGLVFADRLGNDLARLGGVVVNLINESRSSV